MLLPTRIKVRKVGWYSWKGGTYNGEAELLSIIKSRGKVGTSAGLIDACCNAGDEDLAFAEAGVVGCYTAAQVSVSETCAETSWFTEGRLIR
jgi:hypothetical protein